MKKIKKRKINGKEGIKHLKLLLNKKKNNNILIMSSSGYRNVGNEAIIKVIIEHIKKINPQAKLVMNSYDPNYSYNIHKIKSCKRVGLGLFITLLRSNYVIIAGDELINIQFSEWLQNKPIFYRLTHLFEAKLRIFTALLAKTLNKKVIFYAVGISSIPNIFMKFLMHIVFNTSDFVSVRNNKSKEILQEIGVKNDIIVVNDPGFYLKPINKLKAKKYLSEEGININKVLVGLSLRSLGDKLNLNLIKNISQTTNCLLKQKNIEIVCFIFSKHRYNPIENDITITEELKMNVKNKKNFKIISHDYAPDEVKGMVGCMNYFIGMRLHSIIFASSMKVPFVCIPYNIKHKFILKQFNQENKLIKLHKLNKLKNRILKEIRLIK